MGYSIFDETMADMTWPQIEKAVGQGAIALLPTGVIEEHGPHMGLGVDTYIAYMLCRIIKHELEAKGVSTLITPPYYWGINNATSGFPGSFTVRKETMKAVLYDTLSSLSRWRMQYVFNINWHGEHEHNLAILEAIKEARKDLGITAYCILTEMDIKRMRLNGDEDFIIIQANPPLPEPPPRPGDMHAGSLETGLMLHYFPGQVDSNLAKTLKPADLSRDDYKVLGHGGSEARRVIPGGYFGDPAGFNTEVAKNFLERDAKDLAGLIENVVKGKQQF